MANLPSDWLDKEKAFEGGFESPVDAPAGSGSGGSGDGSKTTSTSSQAAMMGMFGGAMILDSAFGIASGFAQASMRREERPRH